jgi:hypothetical protein
MKNLIYLVIIVILITVVPFIPNERRLSSGSVVVEEITVVEYVIKHMQVKRR